MAYGLSYRYGLRQWAVANGSAATAMAFGSRRVANGLRQ